MTICKTSNKANQVDMLHGPLLMKILLFSLPLAASSVLQQLFNSIDVAVVGRFVGSEALAAVGSNSSVISLLINLFVGISLGANAIISNHIGSENEEGVRRAVGTVSILAIASGLFLMVLGWFIARPILELIDTPEEVLDMAVLYLRIYFLGIPFFLIFNFGSAILRSKGDTRRPLYILVVAGIINTGLNLFFVLSLGMGVEGVAIATGIANAFSAISIVVLLFKEDGPLKLDTKYMRIHGSELKRILKIGVPAGLQGMVFSVSNVIVQSTINTYGASAIAGSAAALNFEYYCYFIVVAFNGAAISFIGQNYGAGKLDRVSRIFWICMGMSVVLCLGANLLFSMQDKFFLDFFSTDAVVHKFGAIRLHTVLAFQSIACSYEIAGSCLRGMGRSLTPTLFTIFGTCLLRIIWVYVVCPNWHGFENLLLVYPISWILTGSMVVSCYFVVLHREKVKNNKQLFKA